MFWTKDVPATDLDFAYTRGEVLELWEAVRSRDLKHITDELCDVYTTFICAVTTLTGLNIPILWDRSLVEWLKRLSVWEDIFKAHGLIFDVKYLVNGGNYERAWKVKAALDLAHKDQD